MSSSLPEVARSATPQRMPFVGWLASDSMPYARVQATAERAGNPLNGIEAGDALPCSK